MKNISLIIPHFNQESYLAEAIQSAIESGYTDVVVVDDGSMDEHIEKNIVSNFGGKVRFTQLEKNYGVSVALNTGFAKALNSKVRWLSADDILPKLNDSAILENVKSKVVYGNYNLVDEFSNLISAINIRAITSRWAFRENHDILALLSGALNGCAVMIDKELFQKVGGFDPKLRATQDYDLWLRLLKITSFEYVDETLVNYRIHNSQGSNSEIFVNEGEQYWLNLINEVEENYFAEKKIEKSILFCIIYSTLYKSKFKAARDSVQKRIIEFYVGFKSKIVTDLFLEGITKVNVFIYESQEFDKTPWALTLQDSLFLYKLSNKLKKKNIILSNYATSKLLENFSKNLVSTLVIKFIFLRVNIFSRLKYYCLKKIVGFQNFKENNLDVHNHDESPIGSWVSFEDCFIQILFAEEVITALEGELKSYSRADKAEWLNLINKIDIIYSSGYMRC